MSCCLLSLVFGLFVSTPPPLKPAPSTSYHACVAISVGEYGDVADDVNGHDDVLARFLVMLPTDHMASWERTSKRSSYKANGAIG